MCWQIYRRDLYLPNRKPQGNTVLDFFIVLYMPVKRQDLILFKMLILAIYMRWKSASEFLHRITVTASNALPNLWLLLVYWVYFDIFCGLGWGFKLWTRWASRFETVRELFICKWNEILLFLVTKVTWYFCFSQGVNSIRGHATSLLVFRKCFKGDETILIWKSSNVYNCKCM